MKRTLAGLVLLTWPAFVPPTAASTEVQRLAVVAGANHGSQDRVALRFAVSDAESVASVLTHLGGVAPADCITLKEPTRQAFLDALAMVRDRVGRVRQEGRRTEVILYYSGHADERGLMLGRDTLSYRDLRDAMYGMAADVGITVLDACASGVITRLKGGRRRPAFLTDDSMRMQGYAFLTSSAENEAAQESERLRGSYFTHALVSGLRGAADANGDGRVTLAEAYQFAFEETLDQTTTTQAGAQHPAHDVRMTGTGDVVMTDVRQSSASLVLGPDFEGRFFVRNGKRQLVTELYKPAGRRAEIGVEAGTYEIQYEAEKDLFTCAIVVADGEHRTLDRRELARTRRVATRSRGGEPGTPTGDFALAGRTRLELSGMGVGFGPSTGGGFSLGLVRWLGNGLAVEGGLDVSYFSRMRTEPSYPSSWTRTDQSFGLWFGSRYSFPSPGRSGRLRPFLRATVGPVAEHQIEYEPDGTSVGRSAGAVSTHLGGGLDYSFGPVFTLGLHAGWNLRTGRKPDVTYSLAFGFSLGGRPRGR